MLSLPNKQRKKRIYILYIHKQKCYLACYVIAEQSVQWHRIKTGKGISYFTVSLSCFHMIRHVFSLLWLLCLWEGCQKGPSEIVNTGVASASHSESIPQSVCAPLTQCSLWTLSAVLFLSSQITAFQMGSSPWHAEPAQREAREVEKKMVRKFYRTRPCVCSRMQKKLHKFHNTCAHTCLGNLRSAQFPFYWHFFQMPNHSPGTSYTDLQGSSLRMSNQTVNLYKALDKVQCPLSSHSEAWGGKKWDIQVSDDSVTLHLLSVHVISGYVLSLK